MASFRSHPVGIRRSDGYAAPERPTVPQSHPRATGTSIIRRLRVSSGNAFIPTLAATALLLLGTACVDRQVTEPERTDDALPVVRSYPGGCVPEATTTYEGNIERILISFTPIDTACSSGFYDLSQYGIDMADPVATDTPQSSMRWNVASGASLQNLPSPGYAAGGLNSVYQAFIEFDPLVQSVTFHYSSPVQNAHWGGLGGPLQIGVDSMPVYAVMRTPGTFQYLIWDSETLHANAPDWDQLDTWDEVTLSIGSNFIQWLWFDGPVYIDDLEITRVVGPALQCTDVQRGQETTCTIERQVDSVAAWEFQGLLPSEGNVLHTVTDDTSGAESWSGLAAVTGLVTVSAFKDGSPVTFSDSLIVQPRSLTGAWDWSSKWNYVIGTGLPCQQSYDGWVFPNPDTLGEHTSAEDCRILAIAPIVQDTALIRNTYSDSTIASGPNKGLVYVAEAYYHMDHGSYLNPALAPGAPGDTLTTGVDRRACKKAFGSPPDLVVNTEQYNVDCKKKGNDWQAMLDGVERHEGMGTSGQKNGHEAQTQLSAGQPQHDPFAFVEPLVTRSDSALVTKIRNHMRVIDVEINNAGADHSVVQGNWCGKAWVLYVTPAPKHFEHPDIWLDAAAHICF